MKPVLILHMMIVIVFGIAGCGNQGQLKERLEQYGREQDSRFVGLKEWVARKPGEADIIARLGPPFVKHSAGEVEHAPSGASNLWFYELDDRYFDAFDSAYLMLILDASNVCTSYEVVLN
jgi:hypothetical protein